MTKLLRCSAASAVLALACHHRDTASAPPSAATPVTASEPVASEPAPAASEPAATEPAAAPAAEPPSAPPEPSTGEPEPAKPTPLLADANVTIEGVSADGLELSTLACALDSTPLFASLAIIGALAKQDAAIDRCAPAGDAVIARWRFDAGRTREVTLEGGASERVRSCVAKALGKVAAPFDARCAAIIRVGKADGADRALQRLPAR
ncbi:MAG: hypothetical protein K1X88_36200 [Nannocystaceae bacterium]|nr:hypothetical protein [Nannocystaceae bacterium]